MNRKRIGIILIVFGALLALGVGAIVYTQMEQAAEIAARTPTVDVVVALSDLPERVAVPASAVSVAKVPANVVPVEAATQIKDVVGKYPLTKVYKSEVVIKSKLADAAGQTGTSFTLKPGMVAVTYAGNESLSGTGAVRPGDKVDILLTLPMPRAPTGGQVAATIPMVTQTMLQSAEVLRVGPFPAAPGQEGGGAGAAGKSITFQLSHQDALVLKWAKDAGGVVDLVLRHPSDQEPVATEAITAQYVFRRFRFTLAEPLQ